MGSSKKGESSSLMRSSKQSYESWFHEESKELLGLLVEEVKEGNQRDNGTFRKDVIEGVVLKKINTKLGGKKNYKHFKNKLRNWRQKLEPVEQFLVHNSGFGWNDQTQNFTASDEVWKKMHEAHPNAPIQQDKIFEDYDALKKVVGANFATGKDAGGVGTGHVDEQVNEEDDDKEEEGDSIPPGSAHADSAAPNPSHTSMVVPSSSSSTSKRRKLKAVHGESSAMENQEVLHVIASGVSTLEDSVKQLTEEVRALNRGNEKWQNALETTPRVTRQMRWRALEVMTTQEVKDAFVRMSNDERIEYIMERVMRQ